MAMTNEIYAKFLSKSISYCKDEIPLSRVIECIKNISEAGTEINKQSIVSDLLWFIDTVSTEYGGNKSKQNFVNVIKACEKSLKIDHSFIKDRLSDETLENLRIINSKQQFSGRYVKTKTRVFYKQNKFNLIREANEGFCKLIVELLTFCVDPKMMGERIKSLIGYFDLDPNRVIDLILDVMEFRINTSDKFISLLNYFKVNKKDICDLIGHKLSMSVVPKSLYQLIVILICNNVIDLTSIYKYLLPTDVQIKAIYHSEVELAKTKKNNASKLKDEEISGLHMRNNTASNGDSNKNTIDEPVIVQNWDNNQKIMICYYFLEVGDWENCRTMIEWLPPYFIYRHVPFLELLCNYISQMIQPLYDKCFQIPAIKKDSNKSTINLPGYFNSLAYKFEDLNKKVFELTNYLGPLLSKNKILFNKLVRITASYYMDYKVVNGVLTETYQGYYNLINNCLIPSLSMLNADIPLAEELWDAIKNLPFDMRYNLYLGWNDLKIHNIPIYHELIYQKRSVQQNVKYILRRLSKENVKQYGRQLGKLCHCNPGIVFNDILDTIIMFSNQVAPIVDTFKYLGNLSLDVLMYCIITTLTSKKFRLDDTQHSQRIQVLSNFCGLLCKRYQFDLVGLFNLILNKIKDGQCGELQIIKEIIHKMTGIEVSEEMTDDQMEAMSGGDLLRQEAGYFIQIRNVRKNSARLKDVLIEHNLAIPFVIMLSQERNLVIKKTEGSHLKVIGKLYDECHDTMLQIMSFFSIHWSASEMVINFPDLNDLLNVYNVGPDVAFAFNRTKLNYKIMERFEQKKKTGESSETNHLHLYHMASQELIDEYTTSVIPNFESKTWDDFNVSFYTTFWMLQTSDLKVPVESYKRQEASIKAQIQTAQNDSSLNSFKCQKEIERCNSLLDKLKEEQKRCESHVKRVDYWLNNVKSKWFVKSKNGPARSVVMTRFIELCVFPRVCFSANDAVCVSELIYKLHRIKTPSFSTLICLDRIFNDITLTISACSEHEAKRYGRFLDAILSIIMKWHASKELYNQECVGHPGFVTVFRKDGPANCGQIKNTDGNNKADQLTYENYRHVLHKWHYRVTKSVVSCLESDSYTQIRNALIVLEKILNNYPKVQPFGNAIERRIETLKEKEKVKRPDLHLLTQSYHGHLLAHKSSWIQEKDFHMREETAKKSNISNLKSTTEKTSVNGSSGEKKDNISHKRNGEEDKEAGEVKKRKIDDRSRSTARK